MAPKDSEKSGIERRRSSRKGVLESFHVFLSIPKSGLRKIYLKDVSEHGIGFFGEPEDEFVAGETVDCFFHINPSLRLPLQLKVAHVVLEEGRKKVGCEIETASAGYQVFKKFLTLLDDLTSFFEA